jgi:hypothetical protein|tara:strand:- start:270 stop:563 length:294 start_codon:yes stop_codon:yes gene_type:complete
MKELNISKKLESLIESGNKAFDLLLEEVKKPIDPDLQDDKARNAMKAKKECFMDAQDILMAINKIQNQINEGLTDSQQAELEEKSFKAGFSEKYAKK